MGFGTSVLRRKAGSPEGCQGADGLVSGHFLGLLEYIGIYWNIYIYIYIGIHICQNLPRSVFNNHSFLVVFSCFFCNSTWKKLHYLCQVNSVFSQILHRRKLDAMRDLCIAVGFTALVTNCC